MSFGNITLLPVPKPTVTITPTVAPTTTTTTTKSSAWDFLDKLLPTVNKAVDVVQNIKGGSSSAGGYVSPTVSEGIPGVNTGATPAPAGSNIKTIAIVGGGIAAAGTILYFIFRKKKAK